MLNSESIVIIRNKGEHLLYSKISRGMIGYGWGNVCYIVNFPPGEYLLPVYSKVSGGKVYYIANIPGEGLLCGRFTIRHQNTVETCMIGKASTLCFMSSIVLSVLLLLLFGGYFNYV
jgi:hypothetical protein